MTEGERLFEQPDRERRVGGHDLVPFDPSCCPACSAPVEVERLTEMALLVHGGYGADRSSSRRHCSNCGWSMLAETVETNPRKRAEP